MRMSVCFYISMLCMSVPKCLEMANIEVQTNTNIFGKFPSRSSCLNIFDRRHKQCLATLDHSVCLLTHPKIRGGEILIHFIYHIALLTNYLYIDQ